ncbi:O-methyltransferase [Lasiodiplodia theobromae]|uniref:O-methyltransferase n=1 Tax=Lasiodiplodia theobromae TaxID=45133 RepID=UPI0015C38591|nr:O-methyltransferase [Lasiodiplodia theobromae]KAF4538698.1 O-methyltransferase [Lasiodiplodia theobromae]
MAPTETGKDLAVEEKPESPSYDNADIEVAPVVKDVYVVEGTNNDAKDEDYTSSDSEVTRSYVPKPQNPQTQRQAFKVGDQARLPRRGGPPMVITIVEVQPKRSDWEYQAEDSNKKPVNTISGGVGYEWIKQKRLIRT